MNVLEAISAMREGKKVKGKDWYEEYYCFYDKDLDDFFLYEPEDGRWKELTVEEFTDLYSFHPVERLETLEYEIVE